MHACYSAWLCATAKLNLKKRSRERAQQAGGALHARAGRIGEQVLRPAHFSNFAALAAISQHLTAQGVMSRRRRRRGREVTIGGMYDEFVEVKTQVLGGWGPAGDGDDG